MDVERRRLFFFYVANPYILGADVFILSHTFSTWRFL